MKKIALLTVAVLALGAVVVPASASALTANEILQALSADPALLSQLQALLGGTTSTTGTASAGSLAAVQALTKDLTIGSKGTDVTTLQNWLVEEGYLVMPVGVSTGYFGTITQKALAQWQAENAVTPSAGYFGAKTRGVIATLSSVVTPVGTLPAGCSSTTGYSSTTGAKCDGGTTGVTPSVNEEGSIAVDLAATPANNANVRTMTDVSIYGVDIDAIGSDMSVDRLDLQFAVTPVGGSAQNPGGFINKLSIYDGSTLLKEISVGSSDFIKDSSDRYHIILSGIGFKVSKGTTKTVTVKASVNSISSTDSNRTLTVQGYAGNSNNVRATDTAGFQSYADMSGTANTRTHTFKPAGASTLTVGLDSDLTPDANNAKVSSTNGIEKKTMMAFTAKSESGDSVITKIYAQVNATSTAGLPSTLYLYEEGGSEPLASVAAGTTDAAQSAFTSLNISVPQDTTKKFLIKADFPTTAAGQMASTSLAASSVQWEKPDGSTASTTPSAAIAGENQYLGSAVPVFSSIVGSISDPVTHPVTGTTTSLTGKITFTVKADGGTLTKLTAANITVQAASSTKEMPITITNKNVIVTPDQDTSDGSTATVELSAVLENSVMHTAGQASGQYFFYVTGIAWTVGGEAVTQTWGLEDFKTGAKQFAI